MYRDLLAEQQNTIVGIDLGTTNSLIAISTDCSTRIIGSVPSHGGQRKQAGSPHHKGPQAESPHGSVPSQRSLPSAIALMDDGSLAIGAEARSRQILAPQDAVTSIKRFMGASAAESAAHADDVSYVLSGGNQRLATVELGGREYSAPEISALYLKELVRWAEADLGKTVRQAVITVPAYFNDSQRQATRDAGRIAGLEVLRIVNEPTAAALAYGLQQNQQGKVAIYDFGGGTFDVSILRLTDGVFEVLATGGDTRLGGDDIDLAVASELYQLCMGDGTLNQSPPEVRQSFIAAAERAKHALTTEESASVEVRLADGEPWKCEVTRQMLSQWASSIVERTLAICRDVLKDSGVGLGVGGLDEVILVGGSSRMPVVQEAVESLFGRTPLCEIDPEEVVALGAAVQGRILAGGLKDMLLLDVTPLSLGIESWGGGFDVIVPRNTTVPTSATQTYTTNVEGQKHISIHVLQGERELVKDNRSLARFTLSDLPPMPTGEPRIEVTFNVDADGLLKVSARELKTGREAGLEIQPSSGLTDDEVKKIVEDSYSHAGEDLRTRMLLERRNEAESVLRAINKALAQSGDAITEQYRREVEDARDALGKALESEDPERVKSQLEETNEVTQELATIQMNEVLKSTVEGRTLDSVTAEGVGLE